MLFADCDAESAGQPSKGAYRYSPGRVQTCHLWQGARHTFHTRAHASTSHITVSAPGAAVSDCTALQPSSLSQSKCRPCAHILKSHARPTTQHVCLSDGLPNAGRRTARRVADSAEVSVNLVCTSTAGLRQGSYLVAAHSGEPSGIEAMLCYLQDVVKEVLVFAEMSGDAPVQPQPDAHDFPELLPASSPDTGARSPTTPHSTPPPLYRCDREDIAHSENYSASLYRSNYHLRASFDPLLRMESSRESI